MATASPTGKSVNHYKLLTLTIDQGTLVIRKIFDEAIGNVPLHQFFAREKTTIQRLKRSGVITKAQYDVLFPPSGNPPPATADLDFIQVVCLLRALNACGLNPNFNWNAPPQPGDTSMEADLKRLRMLRNALAHISSTTAIDDMEFHQKWIDIEQVLLRLNGSLRNPIPNLQQCINDLKNGTLFPEEQNRKNEKDDTDEEKVLRLQQELDEIRKRLEEKQNHEDNVLRLQQELDEMTKKLEEKQNQDIQQQDNVPMEIENDPYYLNLYTEAISKGKEIDTTIRINVVGNFRQGKTSLVKQLLQESTEGVESTNSVEINHCTYEINQDQYTFAKEQPKNEDDFVGRLAAVAQSEMKNEDQDERKHSQNSMQTEVPTSVVSSDSEITIELMHDVRSEENTELSGFRGLDISTPSEKHINIETKTIFDFEQEIKRIQQENQDIDTSQRDLEIWDFGGQYSFYATHNLFHSRRAVYLLVFDLTKPLSSIVEDSEFPDKNEKKTLEQYAKFWINSVHAYVGSDDGREPPVILVGTHKDKLEGNEDEKEEFIYEYFEQIRKLFENTNMIRHIQLEDYAVDTTNTHDDKIVELRREVIQQGTKLAEISIPAKWIPLERAVRSHKNKKIISFKELMDIDSSIEFPLKEEEQVKLFLRYHHSKGTILFYDEAPISSYVVLDPQYLIDAFRCIITSRRFCLKDTDDVRKHWNTLINEARLENCLIDKLWKRDADFQNHKEVIIMFLEKHLIISEALDYSEEYQRLEGLGWYIVPSLLRSNSAEDVLTNFLSGRQRTSVRVVMSFDQSPLVQVLFYRLLAALIGNWPIMKIPVDQMSSSGVKKEKTLIYENLGVFELDDNHAGIVVHKYNDIDLWVHTLCPSLNVSREMADKFRRFSESIVQNEFVKLRHSRPQQEIPFTVYIKCNDESHGPSGGGNKVPLEEIRGNTKGKRGCPDRKNHEIYPDEILSEWYLEDKIKMVCPDHQLKDEELSKVALALGYNWELLGFELGLGRAQIQQIDMDINTSEMKIYTMLLLWKAEKEDLATIKVLIDAMETDKRVFVQWDIIRNIVDKINSERQESLLTNACSLKANVFS